jgi:HSP20 family molecular chaperone IbpA
VKFLQVEAKHEEKTADGHSYSTRSFQQSFTLPRGVDLETITSALSKVKFYL